MFTKQMNGAWALRVACAVLLCTWQAPGAAAEFERGGAAPPIDQSGYATHSDDFNLIAIAEGEQVRVLLERFGEARPVQGARIAIHGAGQQASVSEIGQGAYVSKDAWLLAPGKKALAFEISADGVHDVLVMVFDPAVPEFEQAPREEKYGPRKTQP